jgi:hypothetical protein
MSVTVRELRDLCDKALAGDRDERWDAMLQGGPLQPERVDIWTVSSAPSGEDICQLSSRGKWPDGGIARVRVLADYIAAANPATVRALIRTIDELRASEQTAGLDELDIMALRWLYQFADRPARRALDKLLGGRHG